MGCRGSRGADRSPGGTRAVVTRFVTGPGPGRWRGPAELVVVRQVVAGGSAGSGVMRPGRAAEIAAVVTSLVVRADVTWSYAEGTGGAPRPKSRGSPAGGVPPAGSGGPPGHADHARCSLDRLPVRSALADGRRTSAPVVPIVARSYLLPSARIDCSHRAEGLPPQHDGVCTRENSETRLRGSWIDRS